MSDISPTSAADENRLWLMLKAGNPAALELLFRQYYQHLYDYGMRFYAQDDIVKDAIQDVFATIWERKAFLGDVQSVLPYLLASLRRTLLKRLAQQRKTVTFNTDLHDANDDFAFSPEEFVLHRETDIARKRMVQSILGSIPPRMREALYLKIFKEFTYSQIAEVMGISYQVARNYVFEALQRLRQLNPDTTFQA